MYSAEPDGEMSLRGDFRAAAAVPHPTGVADRVVTLAAKKVAAHQLLHRNSPSSTLFGRSSVVSTPWKVGFRLSR